MKTIPIIKRNLLALTACFLWSTAFAVIKIGLQFMTPLLFAGTRFMIAGMLLIPFCGNLKNYFITVGKNIKHILILGFFQTFCLYSLFFVGMSQISGALGAIIIGSSPLIAALTSHVLQKNDKINLKKLTAILIGISGIVIISVTRQPFEITGTNEILGILLLLCSAVSSAVGNVIVSNKKVELNAFVLNSSQMFLGGLMIFILSLPTEGINFSGFSYEFLGALLWLCIVSAGGFTIWFFLLQDKDVRVSELNVWKFVIPVLGAVLSWIIISDEHPELFIVIGMIIVGSSIIIFNLFSKK